MNPFNYSLIKRIRFLGLVLALLIVVMLFLAYEATNFYAKREQMHHAIKILELLSHQPEALSTYLNKHDIEVFSEDKAKQVLNGAPSLILDPLIRSVVENSGLGLYLFENHILFVVNLKETTRYFRSKKSLLSTIIIPLSIYAILLFLLLYGIYYFIKNSLSPLVRLNKNIESFSRGDEIVLDYQGAQDEIANVANAFYSAVERNKKLTAHRDMYIRTIMHEIKTPLTKAKFITHFMKENEEEKEKLNSLFDSMQEELDKLHEFESVNTKILKMQKASYSLKALVDDVCDALLLSEEEVEIQSEKVLLDCDYTILMVAVKNLVENALKYSKDAKVKICIKQKYLEVKNLSKEDHALDLLSLIEPFKREDETTKGMGLGLYLVNEIVHKHHFSLAYEFINKYHCFRIVF